jgi:hypothetical protein
MKMSIRKHLIYLIISFIFLVGCTPSRIKTFLDFELGMTYVEYSNHAIELRRNLIIQDLNPNDYKSFNYSIKLSDSDYVHFNVQAYVYPSGNLTMISGRSSQVLNLSQKKKLVEVFANRNGSPSTALTEYNDDIWRATWENDKNIDIRLVFTDSSKDETKTYFHFMASGNFNEKIDPDKSIKINNAY